MLVEEELTERILGCAIEVHTHLGPGLLESAYEACLLRELEFQELSFEAQRPVPIQYKGRKLHGGFRCDIVVEDRVIVEVKAVQQTLPIHEAQLLTYLRLSGLKVGLLLNFNVRRMRDGILRRVL